MTALAPVPAPAVRPVAWPRLGWVSWRRYRPVLAAVMGVLALIAIYVVVDGWHMRAAYAAYLSCTPTNSARCQFAWMNFRDGYGVSGLLVIVLTVLPGVIGAFAGAPVLARELETGTFRYTWTQGVGRMRWGAALLIPGAVGVTAIMGAFGMLAAWYNQPLADSGIVPRLRSTVFAVTGLAPAGWALAGFALGLLAGLLWRRVLPALASAFAVWFGLAFLTATVLRPNYLRPLTTTSQDTTALELSGRDLALGQWWTKGGARVSDAEINDVLRAIGFQDVGGKATVGPGGGGSVDPVQYLLGHGYVQVTSYQPDSRFWTFQWIEFGWLAILAVALLSISFWLLRRRVA